MRELEGGNQLQMMDRLNSSNWLTRWDAMMDSYNPHRRACFDLMLERANLPDAPSVSVLDLGCGPGSLSFATRRCYPHVQIMAVDFDPILLAIGRQVARQNRAAIEFQQADLRDPTWWAPLRDRFDCVVSAIALHWLSGDGLVGLYRQVFDALKPGGQFLNLDHMAQEDPTAQDCVHKTIKERREAAFSASRADRWNDFWAKLKSETGLANLNALRRADDFWEGTDDGYPPSFHVETLKQIGFEQAAIGWETPGDGLLSGHKPCKFTAGPARPGPSCL